MGLFTSALAIADGYGDMYKIKIKSDIEEDTVTVEEEIGRSGRGGNQT